MINRIPWLMLKLKSGINAVNMAGNSYKGIHVLEDLHPAEPLNKAIICKLQSIKIFWQYKSEKEIYGLNRLLFMIL